MKPVQAETMNLHPGIQVFEHNAQEYDRWFDEHRFAYESEVIALKKLVPGEGMGLDVGAGTGRFAVPLGIRIGVEPARAMAEIAWARGIEVVEARAEELPFGDSSFDFVLMVVTICFVADPLKALMESKRVLRPGGRLIIGMIDGESFLGRLYRAKKSKFYMHAKFYSAKEVLRWLETLGFGDIRTCQTIFRNPEEIKAVEPVKEGHGIGGFVVISGQKGEDTAHRESP